MTVHDVDRQSCGYFSGKIPAGCRKLLAKLADLERDLAMAATHDDAIAALSEAVSVRDARIEQLEAALRGLVPVVENQALNAEQLSALESARAALETKP